MSNAHRAIVAAREAADRQAIVYVALPTAIVRGSDGNTYYVNRQLTAAPIQTFDPRGFPLGPTV